MPIKLVPPRKGKSPNWTIRGSYLGIRVDETTGTADRATARRYLDAKIRQIECDRLAPAISEETASLTFIEAALAYIEAGGSDGGLGKFDPDTGAWSRGLIAHFGKTPIATIDQLAIDRAAAAILPHASAATRNRWVYTPVSAILKHAGVDKPIRRPKGWRGSARVDWMQPELAFRLVEAAKEKDAEFGAFLTVLLYTGMRLSEALSLTCDRLSLAESWAYLPKTKNSAPRLVHLPPVVVAALANHPRGIERDGRVFRFRKCGRLYTWLKVVKEKAGPDAGFVTFHTFRHTWATWMRRYAEIDTRGLVATQAWSDPRSAARYEHVVQSEEARRADLLPTPRSLNRRGKSVEKPKRKPQVVEKKA